MDNPFTATVNLFERERSVPIWNRIITLEEKSAGHTKYTDIVEVRAGGFPKFKARFERKWSLSALKYIFLTHHHDDHSGFLNELLEATDAKVILHSSAVQHLQDGRNSEPPGAGYSSFPASLFGRMKKDFSFPPVFIPENRRITVASEDEQAFERLGLRSKVLLLPGHTDDSIGLYLPDSGIMFCGDAAMNAVISVARHTIWIEDATAYGRSWDKMLSYRPKMIYPSHGNPFGPQDLVKYRNFMAERKLIQLTTTKR